MNREYTKLDSTLTNPKPSKQTIATNGPPDFDYRLARNRANIWGEVYTNEQANDKRLSNVSCTKNECNKRVFTGWFTNQCS